MLESPHPPELKTASVDSPRGVFVGRQREMDTLVAALEEALSGRGRLVMLAGEPGIGKTRTAQELASHAQALGAQVLWGRCYEEAGAPPYWPWLQPLRSYIQQQDPNQLRSQMGPGAADIAQIISEVREKLPSLEPPPALEPGQARFRLFDSITTFLKNASGHQPLVMVLDNLHWADKSSLLLLEFLAQELGESCLLVVGTYRDAALSRQHPLFETLGELAREGRFQRVLLRGLGQEDVGRFIEAATGRVPPSGLLRAVYTQTEGNPFFIIEVVRWLAQEGELTPEEGSQRESWSVHIPEGVREVIGRRLNRLSQQCNEALTVASVIGREFGLEQLGCLIDGLPENQLLEALEEALRARIIEEMPRVMGRYQFTHALIQQTLLEELSTTRRVRLHARIGEALEGLYRDNLETHAGELAHHFAEAVTITSPAKLAHYSLLAGERALAAYAWEEALQHFQRGLDAVKERFMDSITARLCCGLGRALETMDRGREAVANLKRTFDYYVEIGDVANAVAIVEYPYTADLNRNLKDILQQALPLVPQGSLQHARLLNAYGLSIGLRGYSYEPSRAAFDEALAIARKEADVALEIRILAATANVEGFHARWPQSLERSLRALDLASQVDIDPVIKMRAHIWAGNSCRCLGFPDQAQAHATELALAAESLHNIPWLNRSLLPNISLAYLAGQWEGVSALARQSTDQEHRLFFSGLDVLSEFQRGAFEKGKTLLDELLPSAHANRRLPGYIALVGAFISRITGNVEILNTVEALALESVGDMDVEPCYAFQGRVALALIAVQRNDAARARETYQLLTPHRGTLTVIGEMSIDRVLGLLTHTIGNQDLAVQHFEDALAFCRKAGYRPELAWTCHDYADALLQGNDPSDHAKSKLLLEESLAISSELGMKPLMQRVTGLVERLESRPAPAPTYPDGLTGREVEVLRLIASGQSNREIAEELTITLKTVARHVSNIFAKISCSSRAEAAAYAFRHGLVQ